MATAKTRHKRASGSATALDWRQGASRGAITGELWEQPALTEVRTLLAAGNPEHLTLAAELLAESRAHAMARNSNRRLIEIDALQALVLAAQEDTGGARCAASSRGTRGARRCAAAAGGLRAGFDWLAAGVEGGRRCAR